MAKYHHQQQYQQPVQVVEGEFVQSQTGQMTPYQSAPLSTPVQRMPVQQTGQYYQATTGHHKSIPVYTVVPTMPLAVLSAYRSVLSCFRHRPFWAVGCSIVAGYTALFTLAAGANLLRNQPRYMECDLIGCLGPVQIGSNLTAWARGTVVDPVSTRLGDTLIDSSKPGTRTTRPVPQVVRETVE